MSDGSGDGQAPAEASRVDVSILVVSYNTCALTLACLDSIAAETRDCSYEVIVVDNASADGSAEAIARHASRPRLIASRQNLGFARANNVAAAEASGEFILLLNPDTIIRERAIDRLRAFALRRPEARIWGGRTLFADGRLNPSSCWGRMTVWNQLCRALGLTGACARSELFNGEAYGRWDRGSERAVDIVSGCFLMIRRDDWATLGGFDTSYFMYGEEADLCLRAARAIGARPRVTPEATIVHYGGASERARAAKMIKLLTAKATLIRRHWPAWQVPLGLALMAAWPLSRWLACAVAGRILRKPGLIEAAAVWGEIARARRQWIGGYGSARASSSLAGSGRPALQP